jgi:NitT/TauT family transport system ATP-binding protein
MRKDSDSNNIIILEKVGKVYPLHNEVALHDINFSVSSGEFVCVIGPSGGGKSTLLKIIAGLEKESSGLVIKPQTISMVFQSGALLPWLNVFDNVALGLRSKEVHKENVRKGKIILSEKEIRREVIKYLTMVGLRELMEKYPADLSGGQRQRVGIARALAVDPSVLLLDEPFSSLDPKITAELHDDLLMIWRETKKTIVMVSHLIEEAVSLAERIVLIKEGKVSHIFPISLPYPRTDEGPAFIREVMLIRKEFFR